MSSHSAAQNPEVDSAAEASASAAQPVYVGRGPITQAIDRVAGAIENAAMTIAALAVLMMMLLVTVSVIGRGLATAKIAGYSLADIGVVLGPIPDDVIFQGLLMIGVIALPLAYIHRRDGHIAVTVTTDWMPTRLLTLLRIFGNLLALVFFFIIGWAVAQEIPTDYVNDATYDGVFQISAVPMKVVFVLSILAFLIRIVFAIAVLFMDLWHGVDPADAATNATTNATEEV